MRARRTGGGRAGGHTGRATLMAAGGPSTPGAATRKGNYMALNGISVSASNGLCKFMKTRKTASGNPKPFLPWCVPLCPGQDSNLHEPNCSLPPQSSVSTNFTTWAGGISCLPISPPGQAVFRALHASHTPEKVCKYSHYFIICKIFSPKNSPCRLSPCPDGL